MNRQTIETVKHFLSQRSDHFKIPYDRNFIDQPRTCIFIATTNNREPLIDDENRRFFPIWCPNVADLDWITNSRDQLWAEVVVRHKAGTPWWVDSEVPGNLAEIVAERQASAVRVDELDGILAEALIGREIVRVEDLLSAAGINRERYDRPMQTRLGNCLRRIGFIRDKTSGWKHRAPLWRRQQPGT